MPKRKQIFPKISRKIYLPSKKGILPIKTENTPKDKEIENHKKVFAFSLILNTTLIIFVLLFNKNLPPEVPLLYNLPEGNEQLAKSVFLIIPAVFAILLSFINIILCLIIKDKFAKSVLVYSLIFISFITFVSIIKIFFLVGNI